MSNRRRFTKGHTSTIATRPSRLGWRRAIVAVTAVSMLVSAATIAVAPSPALTGGSPAKPRCATFGLVIWLDTASNGAAGSIYYKLHLTNLSRHPCTVGGYPGVTAVDLAGRQIGRAATRETIHKATVVTLAPGATATAALRIVDAGNFLASTCHEVTAAGLRVHPPGQAASKLVPFPFMTCSRTGVADLAVRALS